MTSTTEFARQQMIEQQIRAWNVLDPHVLHVFQQVRRELFVPAAFRNVAFADDNVPVGHEQVMLAPKLDGKILQAVDPQENDEILDVGTGTGFLAACLGRLGAHVRSLEIYADLAEQARSNLQTSAANNVAVEVGDAMQFAEESRYDVITVTGSLPQYDARFERGLKVGGRLFVVTGTAPVMTASKIIRTGKGTWQRQALFETVIPALVNAPTLPRFAL